jgi:hypothetical protein
MAMYVPRATIFITSSCKTYDTYLDSKGKREKSKFHLLDDRRVDGDSLESSWSNREQYLLVDVLEDRHDNERTNGKEEGRRRKL